MSKFPSVPARELLTVDCSLYSSQQGFLTGLLTVAAGAQILASTGTAQHGVSPVGVSSLASIRSTAGFEIGPPI
jgi:hypothetical protein